MKKKLENLYLKNVVGKSSLYSIEWNSWSKLPPHDTIVYVIVKLKNGYYPLIAEYLNFGSFSPELNFFNFYMPKIMLNNKKHRKILVAWGILKQIQKPSLQCPICKEVKCVC